MARPCLVAAFVLLAGSALCDDTTIYATYSGSSYHREGCRMLRSSRIALPLSQAVAQGLTPCRVCLPPLLGPQLYRVSAANLSASRDADLSAMLPATVIAVIDGDTIRVETAEPPAGWKPVETIRLLGVDTPEVRGASARVQALAKESSAYVESRLLGRQILLAFDWDLRDRYDRVLAYVYLPEGECVNADLVREGYAHAYTAFPFQFLEEFRDLQRGAREGRRGLWK